jgi:sugar phosphate isomerase/epimerase
MGRSRIDPGRGGGFQIRFRHPHRACDRQLRKIGSRIDHIHIVDNKPQPSSHIDQAGIDRGARRHVEHHAHRVLFSADTEGMDFK